MTTPVVFNQIRTRSYISIGARSVATTRLSFALGVDAPNTIMNFIIIKAREEIFKSIHHY
jgi:hypothetical protein